MARSAGRSGGRRRWPRRIVPITATVLMAASLFADPAVLRPDLPYETWVRQHEVLPGVLDAYQAALIPVVVAGLPPGDYWAARKDLLAARSPLERAFIYKDLVAGHHGDALDTFAATIRGKPGGWLLNHLTIGPVSVVAPGSTENDGPQQQWSHSCAQVAAITVIARSDPEFALLINNGGSITGQDQSNQVLTDVEQTFLIRMGSKVVPQDSSTVGPGTSSMAILLFLDEFAGRTNLMYSWIIDVGDGVQHPDMEQVISLISAELLMERPVVLSLEGRDGKNAHVVVAEQISGDQILIASNGTVGWMSLDQIRTGTMDHFTDNSNDGGALQPRLASVIVPVPAGIHHVPHAREGSLRTAPAVAERRRNPRPHRHPARAADHGSPGFGLGE